jgi:hypothetical protein
MKDQRNQIGAIQLGQAFNHKASTCRFQGLGRVVAHMPDCDRLHSSSSSSLYSGHSILHHHAALRGNMKALGTD